MKDSSYDVFSFVPQRRIFSSSEVLSAKGRILVKFNTLLELLTDLQKNVYSFHRIVIYFVYDSPFFCTLFRTLFRTLFYIFHGIGSKIYCPIRSSQTVWYNRP